MLHKVCLVLQLGAMVAVVPVRWLALLWHKLVLHSRAGQAWVIFDRTVIFLPFDKSGYLAHLGLHLPYEDYVHGPVVYSTGELPDTQLNDTWLDDHAWRRRRAKLRDGYLPGLPPGKGAACYEVTHLHADRPQRQYNTAAAK